MAGHLPRLLADVGGTNVRFARQRDANGPLQDIASLPCADFPGLLEAAQHYLARHAGPAPRCVAVGIATPITGDEVRMTNHHWAFSTRALQASLGAERLLVLNDFTALALALPALPAERRRRWAVARRWRARRWRCWGRAPGSVCPACCRQQAGNWWPSAAKAAM
jgi:glucokinase